jgi:membrane protein implicated in regulation of membrane protease activity
MKNPIRTEAEAFSFVLVVAALAVAVALAAVLGGTWVALGVFLALALGVTVGIYMKSEPKVREPAVWERGRGGRRRILVVANETVAGRALRKEIVHRARGADTEILVVVPALNTRLRHWTSDEDRARAEARERVERSLAALREAGIEARGEVGDSDPIQAIEDALRTFGADEIIISTHPPGRSNWLERNVIDRARETYGCPIAHVVVDLEHERAKAQTAPASTGSP